MRATAVKGRPIITPTTKTQTDIARKAYPSEDCRTTILGSKDIPALLALERGSLLTDRTATKAFVFNTLRMRPIMHTWQLDLCEVPDPDRLDWSTLIRSRELKGLTMEQIAERVSECLLDTESIASIRVSLDDGIHTLMQKGKPRGQPRLTLIYKPVK